MPDMNQFACTHDYMKPTFTTKASENQQRRGQSNICSISRRASLCHLFIRGKCKRGIGCKYSHNQDAIEVAPPSNSVNPPSNSRLAPRNCYGPNTDRNNSFYKWKRLLPKEEPTIKLGYKVLGQFFRHSLELVEAGDSSIIQNVVRQLATNAGLERIKELTDDIIPNVLNFQKYKIGVWNDLIRPYFSFLAHPLVVNSSILENEVGILFNFLGGFNGKRMVTTFSAILNIIHNNPEKDENISEMLALLSFVLLKIINFNTTTLVNETFKDMAEKIMACITKNCLPDDYNGKKAMSNINGILIRLGVGGALQDVDRHVSCNNTKANFALYKDLPGKLSTEGPRHSNDHEKISDIRIFPPLDEVQAVRADYRPVLDSSEWHLQGITGLLDRHYRLIREDTVGQLRDAVRAELELESKRRTVPSQKEGIRVHSYPNATVTGLEFDKRAGFIFNMQCCHPKFSQNFEKPNQKKNWWIQTNRLQRGAVVCLVDLESIVFCRVHELPLSQFETQDSGKSKNKTNSLLKLQIQISDPNEKLIRREVERLGKKKHTHRSLVEFPGVLLDSFKPILEALQKQYKSLDLPFSDLIAPLHYTLSPSIIAPPLYATYPDFAFDLSAICKPGTKLAYSVQEPPKIDQLLRRTTLDKSQAEALFNCLRRSLALVQGPPGTGKSYTGECVIKVLLSNKKKANLGPIICICYTNHALDQLLENLWKSGTKQIIRIGSRSKSEALESVNLRNIAKQEEKSKHERYIQANCMSTLEEIEKRMPKLLSLLKRPEKQVNILKHLRTTAPTFYHFFSGGEDECGYIAAVEKGRSALDSWLKGGIKNLNAARPVETLQQLPPLELTNRERYILHGYWMNSICLAATEDFMDEYSLFKEKKQYMDMAHRELDLRCLRQADIIGVTTTGLAKNINLLRKLDSKALICEEAGEVLEGHLLSALISSIEHAIFIGDHQQLRPQIANYELQSTNPRGAKYSLDMSLFERLVKPTSRDQSGINYDTLTTQRRMHPSISTLIRKTLYPNLIDSPIVSKYPPVMGMKKRLFWLDHSHPEAGDQTPFSVDTSHSNEFEVAMTAALVSHIVRQGVYKKDEIAVLTPYLGQLHKLRWQLSQIFEIVMSERDNQELDKAGFNELDKKNGLLKTKLEKQLRIATVDNFQGEEAKVIVISLVRSNNQSKCGFLRTTNRINVLLSRAQHGMYIFGNSATYKHVDMWATVLDSFLQEGNLGNELELECPRHPDKPIIVSNPDHFVTLSPEGGCQLPCDKRLACGHKCPSKCHSDVIHNAIKCLEPCPRPKKGCDHPCSKLCGDSCEEKCSIIMAGEDIKLDCGHSKLNPTCWQKQRPREIICRVFVERSVPGCQHINKVQCNTNVTDINYNCNSICGDSLSCGHQCNRQCKECRHNKDGPFQHKACKQICGRPYATCKHTCQQPCHDGNGCQPCDQQCEVRCSHSRCSLECNKPCIPCAEMQCASRCPHSQCTLP